jgi:hypothetical protein
MQKALAGILSALAADPSLKMGTGVVRHGHRAGGIFGVWRTQVFVGAGLLLLGAAAVSQWRKRRAPAAAAAPAGPPAPADPPAADPPAPAKPPAAEPPEADPPLPPAA